MKENFVKKILSIILIFVMVLSLSACGDKDTNEGLSKADEEYITTALDKVEKEWKETFGKSKDMSIEIINTRLIKIKKNTIDDFKNVEAVVEFDLLTGPYGDTDYYKNPNNNNVVVFYNDGTNKIFNLFRAYMAKTYDTKFGGVIDEIVELGSKYNTNTLTISDISKEDGEAVEKAATALKEDWKNYYKGSNIKDDMTLNIINTQLIKVNADSSYKNFDKYFKDIDAIVEFEIYTNNYNSAPYYMNLGINNNVIIYKDGTTKIINHYIDDITSQIYSFDFGDAFKTIPLGSKYNEKIDLSE